MDFKKFGTVILILGLLILIFGGFLFFSLPQDIYNYYPVNEGLVFKRNGAIAVLIIAGIIVFIGLGISYSAKKSKT